MGVSVCVCSLVCHSLERGYCLTHTYTHKLTSSDDVKVGNAAAAGMCLSPLAAM